MLGNLAILYTPQVVVAGVSAAVGSLADRQDKVALRQNQMGFIIDHLDSLLGQSRKCGIQAKNAIRNRSIVLDVGVTAKV